MKIGFDVDGTIAIETFESIVQTTIDNNECINEHIKKMLYFSPSKYFYLMKTLLNDNNEIFLITFRWREWQDITLQWIRKNGIQNIHKINCHFSTLDIRTNSNEEYKVNAINFKTKIINDNQLDIYFDDSKFLVDALIVNCPQTKIVNV